MVQSQSMTMFVFIGKLRWSNGKWHARKMQSSKERLHFFCVYHGGNGDHVEGTSCGSESMDANVCLHSETHVVQWKAARKKNAIFKRKIAFFLVFIMVAMEIM